MGIMDGVKWGFGTSIGHSIGNLFGFGTQNVHVENQTRPISPTPTATKTDFEKCVETSQRENKLSYCFEYDKCLKTKGSTSINCAEEAEKLTSLNYVGQ
jgi:hypothetical protein